MQSFMKILFVSLISVLLTACSSGGGRNHTDLYQGVPLDSFSGNEPAVSEEEAIQRADRALAGQNLDLALYEYIRSLSFSDAKHQDNSLLNIGKIHHSRDNFVLAETAYLRSLQFNPGSVESLNQLGVIYNQSGEAEKGKSYFLKAINADQVTQNKPQNIIDS